LRERKRRLLRIFPFDNFHGWKKVLTASSKLFETFGLHLPHHDLAKGCWSWLDFRTKFP